MKTTDSVRGIEMGGARLEQRNRAAWEKRSVVDAIAALRADWIDASERKVIDRVAPSGSLGAVLDLGVGTGRTVPLLQARSTRYVAVDYTAAMVDRSHNGYPATAIAAADARALPFVASSFDLLYFSSAGLDAVDHAGRQAIIAEAWRVLRDGGVFVFSTHNRNGPGFRETPWRLYRYHVRHPVRLLELVRDAPTNLRNYRRNRFLEYDEGAHAMKTAGAHQFSLVVHYVTLSEGRRELQEHGFAKIEAYDNRGGSLLTSDEESRRAWWIYFIAWK